TGRGLFGFTGRCLFGFGGRCLFRRLLGRSLFRGRLLGGRLFRRRLLCGGLFSLGYWLFGRSFGSRRLGIGLGDRRLFDRSLVGLSLFDWSLFVLLLPRHLARLLR